MACNSKIAESDPSRPEAAAAFAAPASNCAAADGGSPSASTVEPLLAFSSRTVELKAAFGQSAQDIVRLTGTLADSARLELGPRDPEGPEVTIVDAGGGQAQGLRFSLTGTRAGRAAGQVVVNTGLPEPETLTVLWSWQVVGNLTVEPTNPVIDLRALDPGVAISVTSTRADFRVGGVDVLAGPFEAHLKGPDSASRYTVDVRVIRSDKVEADRGWTGKLRLTSNDPAEPIKDIPLFAMGPR